MGRKAIRQHMEENPEFRQWVMENRDWLKSNRNTVKGILDQYSYKQSNKPVRGSVRINPRIKRFPKFSVPKLNLSHLTNATSQLSKTVHLFDNLQTIMNVMKLK